MSDNPYIIAGNALEDTSCGDYDVSSAIVDALYDAGLLYMGPRIIRTVEELKALDQNTILWPKGHYHPDIARTVLVADPFNEDWVPPLPAVVVAPIERVRAALIALEKETTND